jgi:hypothetical protein
MKAVTISLRIDGELLDAVAVIAETQRRSRNSMLVQMVDEWIGLYGVKPKALAPIPLVPKPTNTSLKQLIKQQNENEGETIYDDSDEFRQ